MDQSSYHGGCNVIEGTKWAANNWINAGKDRKTDLKVWELARLVEEDYQERMKREPWEEQTKDKEDDIGEEKLKKKESNENKKKTGEDDTMENESKENEKTSHDQQSSEEN